MSTRPRESVSPPQAATAHKSVSPPQAATAHKSVSPPQAATAHESVSPPQAATAPELPFDPWITRWRVRGDTGTRSDYGEDGFIVAAADEDRDEDLVKRLRAHDERAFNEFVRVYEQRIFRLVYRMLGRRDEAEDMAQEVFVQVFKAVGQFRGESKLSTWVYRIAVNLCKNRTKYLSRRHTDAQDELETGAERVGWERAKGVTSGELDRPDQVVEGYQLEDIVRRAISELDAEFREVLVLRDVEDLSYDEIGEITGLPEGTVKSRIFRARGMLKARVEEALGEKVG